ncbi:MAG: hypothetical protein ISS71_07115 [Phycisphaerae bacterium]|nr:hypothetical protein [Phycisphaerae bacterium]
MLKNSFFDILPQKVVKSNKNARHGGAFSILTSRAGGLTIIQALPPELLRKGRFDEIFFVSLPGAEARKAIFKIHLTKRKRDPQKFDMDKLAKMSDGYSGAEIEQAVLSALHEAFEGGIDLDTELLIKCTQASPPISVTMAEHVQELYDWAQGRCVPAD